VLERAQVTERASTFAEIMATGKQPAEPTAQEVSE
jgi:hypothetical protein